MSSCKPYGYPQRAKVLVIGHDPRLQRSETEAQYVFFLDYLERPRSSNSPARRKYDLANATVGYIKHLGGVSLSIKDMYFTNLCNEFLAHPLGAGTVLIPNEVADRGIKEIEDTLSHGEFKVILPMSPQVLYHLVRTGFVADQCKNLEAFIAEAKPEPQASERGAYKPVGRSPFLLVCGRKYRYRSDRTPIIPILHVRQWPLKAKMELHYAPLMEMAARNVSAIL